MKDIKQEINKTRTTKFTSSEDYMRSSDYHREKGRIEGYNEVMHFLNAFTVSGNPEAYLVAKMIEMEFAVQRNQSLTPIADKLGLRISAD